MSVAIGLVDGGRVWIGVDSAYGNSNQVNPCKLPKVIQFPEMLIAISGTQRLHGLMSTVFEPPVQGAGVSVTKYIHRDFPLALRKLLADHQYFSEHDNTRQSDSYHLLIGYRGRLFEIDTQFATIESSMGYEAIGSGWLLALGAMHVLQQFELSATEKIRYALRSVACFDPYVQSPFKIKSI